jgi:enamine deaminase RidA (YjgF/YER057c/UK114 family)
MSVPWLRDGRGRGIAQARAPGAPGFAGRLARRGARRGVLVALSLLACVTCVTAHAQAPGARFINPPGLVHPTGYTHVVVAADGRTAYIAGQVAFDSTGQVVGVGDFRVQAERVFANLRRALASVGASFSDLLKTTTLITDLKNLPVLRETRNRYLDPARAPANTLIPVTALARPELLLEIEAVVELHPPLRR